MGSTGHGLYNHSNMGDNDGNTFGIAGAVNYKGEVPEGSNLKNPDLGKLRSKQKQMTEIILYFSFRLINRAPR